MTWKRCNPICDIILLFIHKGKKLNKKNLRLVNLNTKHHECVTLDRDVWWVLISGMLDLGVHLVYGFPNAGLWPEVRSLETSDLPWTVRVIKLSFFWIQQVRKKIEFRRKATVVSECYPERSLISYCVGGQLKHLKIIDWPSTGSVSM
jgi:hypothetical protein